MRTLYLECNMGCAGDMLSAALYELLDESQQQTYLQTMNNLGLHGVTVSTERVARCGVYGTHMVVSIDGEEEHAHDIDLTASTEHDHDHDHSHGEHEHHHEHEDNDHHHHDHDHGRAAGHHTHEHEHGDHEHGHEHHHHHGAHLADIFALIDAANVSDAAKANAKRIYQQIAEAEAHAHNADIQHIHFHEVGTKDAVVDVLGCCVLLDMLHPDRVVCSPVNVGSGQVRCAHGIVPVPAPATAFLLQNAPSYGSSIKGELCTPTGAALLTAFAHSFGAQPLMKVQATGYGCGTKEFEAANLVRAMLGDAFDAPASADSSAAAAGKEPLGDTDRIVQLSCNLDDMTGEEIAFATQALLDAGALDVFTSAISMKKNRPAVLLCCLCKPADKQRFAQLIFKHTTTLGVRETLCNRYVLARKNAQRETPFGTVGYKQSEGYGATTEKADFDDLAAIAKREGLSLREVKAGIAHGLENE